MCIESFTQAQRLRKEGALIESRSQLRTCADSACPGPIAKDCSKWLEEVQAAIPTIVVAVRDRDGRDVVAAELLVDGVVVTTSLDGKPIEVDPGPHTFRVKRVKETAQTMVVARAGDDNRVIELQLKGRGTDGPAPPPPPPGDEGASALLISGGVLA
ncbi:MAG: hypothetical protein AAGA56_08945, partial [Myxococcota bacterium]